MAGIMVETVINVVAITQVLYTWLCLHKRPLEFSRHKTILLGDNRKPTKGNCFLDETTSYKRRGDDDNVKNRLRHV